MTTKKRPAILQRASEPSTHAGLAALAQVIGGFFPQYALIANVASAAFGALAVGMHEQGKP